MTMSLADRINSDIKSAIKAREKEKLEALRAIKAALLVEATKEGGDGTVAEDSEHKILNKLYKQRKDAAQIYVEQGREDLAEIEKFQSSVIEVYLPEQMSEEEVHEAVDNVIAQLNASGPQDMGKVMGAVMAKLQGKADGNLVSSLVKSKLLK